MQNLFSRIEVNEIMKCMDPDTGHKYFMENYYCTDHFVHGTVKFGFKCNQEKLVDTYHNNRLSICQMPRQSGKTTVSIGYLLWYSVFNSDKTVVIMGHTVRAAEDILSRMMKVHEKLPSFIRADVYRRTKDSVEFNNGTRIIVRPCNSSALRGATISLLYCDEIAFARERDGYEFWNCLYPSLVSSYGKVMIVSSYNTSTDVFGTIWDKAIKGECAFKAHGVI